MASINTSNVRIAKSLPAQQVKSEGALRPSGIKMYSWEYPFKPLFRTQTPPRYNLTSSQLLECFEIYVQLCIEHLILSLSIPNWPIAKDIDVSQFPPIPIHSLLSEKRTRNYLGKVGLLSTLRPTRPDKLVTYQLLYLFMEHSHLFVLVFRAPPAWQRTAFS